MFVFIVCSVAFLKKSDAKNFCEILRISTTVSAQFSAPPVQRIDMVEVPLWHKSRPKIFRRYFVSLLPMLYPR